MIFDGKHMVMKNPIRPPFFSIPPRYSGDNWQVEVRKKNLSGSLVANQVCTYSAVFNGWKRVFVERDKMFRRGGLLFAYDGTNNIIPAGSSTINIFKLPDGSQWDNLNIGDKIALFDSTTSFESWNHDECYVGDIDRSSCPDYAIVYLTLGDHSTPYTTKCSYTASPWINSTDKYPDFSLGSSAGIGVVYSTTVIDGQIVNDIYGNQINGSGSAFYEADMRTIKDTYDDAYVEFVGLRNGMGVVPYLPQSWFDAAGVNGRARFSQIWFKNFTAGTGTPPVDTPHNYFHLIGASDMGGGTLGITQDSYDYTYILSNSIKQFGESNGATYQQITNITQDTTLHEIGHQFKVDYCSNLHDTRAAWCDSIYHCNLGGANSEDCLMNSGESQAIEQIEDGVSRFCVEDLVTGDPNCADTPRSGAIRTDVDPQ